MLPGHVLMGESVYLTTGMKINKNKRTYVTKERRSKVMEKENSQSLLGRQEHMQVVTNSDELP